MSSTWEHRVLTPKFKWYQFKHPDVTESTEIKQGKGTWEAS
jgi:hypothetical protein